MISLSEFREKTNYGKMKYIRESSNFKEPSEYKEMNKFNRFRIKTPGSELENTNYFVFFTKPDCNIFVEGSSGSIVNEQIRNCYYFHDICRYHPKILRNIQYNQGEGDFITPFYNLCESFSLSDRMIKTRDSIETSNDWKTVYGNRINDSTGAGTFNVTLSDTRHLIVFHTLEAWILYIDCITKGFIAPTDKNRDDKILDYAGAVYFFATAEDGKTILYYRKYIGVFPLNIPDNIFSYSIGQHKKLEYDIQFQYSSIDTSPAVITDFNNTNKFFRTEPISPLFDDDMPNTTWVSGCFINENNGKLQLEWVE